MIKYWYFWNIWYRFKGILFVQTFMKYSRDFAACSRVVSKHDWNLTSKAGILYKFIFFPLRRTIDDIDVCTTEWTCLVKSWEDECGFRHVSNQFYQSSRSKQATFRELRRTKQQRSTATALEVLIYIGFLSHILIRKHRDNSYEVPVIITLCFHLEHVLIL